MNNISQLNEAKKIIYETIKASRQDRDQIKHKVNEKFTWSTPIGLAHPGIKTHSIDVYA